MAGTGLRRPGGRTVRGLPCLLLAVVLSPSATPGQTGWETVAGGPLSDRIPLCAAAIDTLHACIGGAGGFIARTTDGGASWTRCYTGTTDDITAICFTDAASGTAVGGEQSTILRTEDGGITWRKQTNGPFGPAESFSSVSFSDPSNGVIVTTDGKIFHTSDGGGEWTSASPQLARGVLRVRLQSSYGLAVGYLGDTYRTSDGGRSWYFHSALTYPKNLRDVALLDSLNILVVGDGGAIRNSTDGGIFWNAVPSGTTDDLRSILFFDPLNGIIGTGAGGIMRTTDGGASWSPPDQAPMSSIRDMSFASPVFGLCLTGAGGAVLRSGDGGISWEPLEYSWSGSFFGACAAGPGSVFAVGENGTIAFSSDSGRHWLARNSGTTAALRDIRFRGTGEGWIAGDSGTVLRTTDGGTLWTRMPTGSASGLRAISAPGEGVAIAVGDSGLILRTSDGGVSWTERPGPVPDDWQAVSFLTPAEGVAAGLNGSIIGTTDGGDSWRLLDSAGRITGIEYLDRDHIYAAGTPAGDTTPGLILSSDGGTSWTFRGAGGSRAAGLSFANPAFGCLAGGAGELLVTQDSGRSWTNRSPSAASFHAVTMAGPRTAFAAGDSGTIARMLAPGAILGLCFHDLDRDGVEDPGEKGLGGRIIRIDGPFADSVLTAPNGTFMFRSLPYATYIVRPGEMRFWEQTAPVPPSPDTLTISADTEQTFSRTIGFAGPSVKIRVPVFVSDNSGFAHRFVWWGIRPGATFGIWATDPMASPADSAEGEFEIPPRSFTKLAGIFDARFSDPGYPLGLPSGSFGEGSWTDMRGYRFTAQRDTFLLSFLPGYYFGGDYPMTLSWSSALLQSSFAGPVALIDRYGTVVDMKSTASVTVTDTSIESFFIVAQSPEFPNEWLARWRLLSLPGTVPDGSLRTLFPSAESRAYSFSPSGGYTARDTLHPNAGYWLKYPSAIDTIEFDPAGRTRDTIPVGRGWNLIGTLSTPVGAGAVSTDPAGLVPGFFFGYEQGYTVADTLLPGKAYWVRASGEGSIILDAAAPPSAASAGSGSGRNPDRLVSVHFEDADFGSGVLYLDEAGDESGPASPELPPPPPDGVFDVRFSSGRMAERAEAGKTAGYNAEVSSARFPLTVTLSGSAAVEVSLRLEGRVATLPPGVPVVITDPAGPGRIATAGRRLMTLIVGKDAGTPSSYALLQNYPNPFNSTTVIPYALPVPSRVTITMYDVIGRKVAVLLDRESDAGYQSVLWDGSDAASGIYFCRMEAVGLLDPSSTFSTVRKIALVR